MSDSYSAYCEAQEREAAREKAIERIAKQDFAEEKLKKCKIMLKDSGLKYIKCCRTCDNFNDCDSSCYKLCISDISEFNVCKYWKLDKMCLVPIRSMKINEDLVYDTI